MDAEIIWHFRNEYFVLKQKDHYLAERLGSPLKYSNVIYDTLFPAGNDPNTFEGREYMLLLKENAPRLINKHYKLEVMRLKNVDDKAREERRRKHNVFYYRSHEGKITEYSRLLREQNKDKHEEFDKDREAMYDKTEELSIVGFQTYFDAFLKKYNLK